jgi:magnesium chelatase subunit D
MLPSFPFSAIVGQERLKHALLLGMIQPSLGGVLVRGTKGVAKSTAVRALAALLPPLPLVELPLGATEDRVLGALHLEKALRGERALEPGLLAAADGGILYVDEVNLLPDHLVDVLLDAAASGVHRVEREGLSLSHAARFLLVGTMNPEEGELRPQLLDRFGLAVDVSDLTDAGARAEAVRRRLAYEADPAAFRAAWQADEAAESERITRARELLAAVRVPEAVLRAISERCLAEGVAGLRADLTLCQAACARAAYHGRSEVEPADVDAVAEFALAHRRTRPPQPPPEKRSQESGVRSQESGVRSQIREGSSGQAPWRAGANGERGLNPGAPELQIFDSAGLYAARARPTVQQWRRSTEAGRWRAAAVRPGGPASGAARPYRDGDALAWAATLRAAAAYPQEREGPRPGGLVRLHAADLRGRARRGPAGCLLLFVVDTSGSMAAWRRMRQTKAAILSLLVQAYRRRDRVALLAFRGTGAELVLPPARGLTAARAALEELPVGGATPLAHGLAAAVRLIGTQSRRHPRQPVWVVVLTDGRANVPASSADAWADALAQARGLAACAAECLVVDTETGWPRLGKAGELARVLGAECLAVEQVLGQPLADPWRRAV